MTLPAVLPGVPPVVVTGENTAEAARQAARAETAAEAAEDFVSDALDAVVLPTRKLTGTIEATANLFDKNDADVVLGKYVHPSGGTLTSGSYNTTGFIPVSPSTDYYASSGSSFWGWYDASKNFIGATGRSGNVYTSPAGAAFLRYSPQSAASLDTFYITQGNAALSSYQPYGGRIIKDTISGLTSANLADGAVTPAKTSYLVRRKNLFRKSTAAVGYYAANGSGPTGTTYSHNTDLIPVTAGQNYVCNTAIRFLTAYDSSGVVITAQGSNTQINAGTTITPASGVAFYRISVLVGSVETCQFEQGTTSTGYSDWGFDMPAYIGATAAFSSEWEGKTVAFLGDSLTAQRSWITPIVSELGLIEDNYGIGGTRISGNFAESMWQDVRINAIPTTVDAVVFMGGTNDWANNVTVGSITDTDATASVYGALNVIATKLKARFPLKRIFWGTVPYSEMTLPRAGFSTGSTNTQGTIDAYNAAIRAVAQREGFALIDFYREAGFNDQNITTYHSDDGNRIHPTASGGKRMASVGIGRLRDLEPVE